MDLTFSLMVLFLLYLKGLFAQNDTVFFHPGSVCAPAGSTVALESTCLLHTGWKFQSWKLRINNTETLADPSKDSRYRYNIYKGLSDWWCYLLIHSLKETDAGIYYMRFVNRNGNTRFTSNSQSEFTVHVTDLQVSVDSDHVTEGQNVTLTCKTSCPPKQTFIWFKNGLRLDLRYSGDQLHVSAVSREDSGRYSCALEHFETFPSAETLLNVTHAVYESAAIITLLYLLIPVVLLLVCLALWMIRTKQQNLKRLEAKEHSKQVNLNRPGFQ
uniref:Ig-like domain-containing protein n=1 Tax=Cyprinus carpio TaxID=7962 RepID=A0A8C1XWK3_CYPCA